MKCADSMSSTKKEILRITQKMEDKLSSIQRVKAVGDAWVICKSKSHSRIYYFNTLTGKAVWNLSKSDLDKAQSTLTNPNFNGQCPEPIEPPVDNVHAGPSWYASTQNQQMNSEHFNVNPNTCQNHFSGAPAVPAQVPMPSQNPEYGMITQRAPATNNNLWAAPPHNIFNQTYVQSGGIATVQNTGITLTNRFGQISNKGEISFSTRGGIAELNGIKSEDEAIKSTAILPPNDLRKKLMDKRKIIKSTDNDVFKLLQGSSAQFEHEEPRKSTEKIEEQMQCLNVTANKFEKPFNDAPFIMKTFGSNKHIVTFNTKNHANEAFSMANEDGHVNDLSKTNVLPAGEDEEDDEKWISGNVFIKSGKRVIEVQPLKELSGCGESAPWYVAPDANVFCCNLQFLKVLIESDEYCRLLVSERVYIEMQLLAKQSVDKQSGPRARSACRLISELLNTGKAVTDRTLLINHPDLNRPIGDDHILNVIMQLAAVDYQIVFISNDKILERKSTSSRLNTFTVKQLKNFLSYFNQQRKYKNPAMRFSVPMNEMATHINENGKEDTNKEEKNIYSYKTADLSKMCRTVSQNSTKTTDIAVVRVEKRHMQPSTSSGGIYKTQYTQVDNNFRNKELVEKCVQTTKEESEITGTIRNAELLWGFSNAPQTSTVTQNTRDSEPIRNFIQPFEIPVVWNTSNVPKVFQFSSRATESPNNLLSKACPISTQTSEMDQNMESNFLKSTKETGTSINNCNDTYNSRKTQTVEASANNIRTTDSTKTNEIPESTKPIQRTNNDTKVKNSDPENSKQRNDPLKTDQNSGITESKTSSANTNPANAGFKKREIRLKRTTHLPITAPNVIDKEKKPFKWRKRRTIDSATRDSSNLADTSLPRSIDPVVNSTFKNVLNSTEEPQVEANELSGNDESFSDLTTSKSQSIRSPRIVEESTTESVISNTRSSVYSETLRTLNQVRTKLTPETKKRVEVVETDKSFQVTDPKMEESLRTGCEEWLSRFVQITEEVLTQILQRNGFANTPHLPPWSMYEAAQCILNSFSTNTDIQYAANKFSEVLFKISDERGHLPKFLEPRQFMEMFTYGVNLVHTIQKVLRGSEDIRTAIQSLSKLLEDIKDPNKYFIDNSTSLTENVNNTSHELTNEDTPLVTDKEDGSNKGEADQKVTDQDTREKSDDKSTEQNVKIVRKLGNFGSDFNSFKKTLERKKQGSNPQTESLTKYDENTDGVDNENVSFSNVPTSGAKVKCTFRICPEFEKRFKRKPCLDLDALDYSEEYDAEDNNACRDTVDGLEITEESDVEIDENKFVKEHETSNTDDNNIVPVVIGGFIKDVGNNISKISMFCRSCLDLGSKKVNLEEKNELVEQANISIGHLNDLLKTLACISAREARDPANSVSKVLRSSKIQLSYREIVEKFEMEAKTLLAALDCIINEMIPNFVIE